MKRGYVGDIVPLLPAMLAGAAVDLAPLPEGNTSGSAEDSMQLKELLVLVPTLVTRINSLEKELKDTKQTLGNVVLKLVKKVKSLETALKRKSKKVLISESKGKESEDQGRKIQDIDDDPLVSLVRESMKEKLIDVLKIHTDSNVADLLTKGFNVTRISMDLRMDRCSPGKYYSSMVFNSGSLQVNSGRLLVNSMDFKLILIKTSKKHRFDDKDVPAIEDKVAEVKEEESVKRIGKRKKQKARKGVNVDKSAQEDSETDKEESVEDVNPTPLTTKFDIYMSFGAMVKDFTREDLIELYRLVMQKYGTNKPEDAYDRVLWSDLRTMFDPPLNEDAIWSLPLQQKMVSWRSLPSDAENEASIWKNE
ncbi:hypothetical protein Tco_1035796 [Tanacetum coccineum]